MHESRKEKTVQKRKDFIGSEGRRIRLSVRRDATAQKIGFALLLIRIKDEVKYNNIFDNTFDAHQKYVKYVTTMHIPLTRIECEFKCI